MTAIRPYLAGRRVWLAVLLALTLAARLAVPAGFMPSAERGTVLILCPAGASAAMPAMHHAQHDAGDQHHDASCPFGAMAATSLGAIDPPLLAVALLFALVLALRAAMPVPPAPASRWRPPLRAPPFA